MTSLERVMGRLKGTPVDRVPWFGLLSLYGARLTGASLEQHYRDPGLFSRGVDAVVDRFAPDIVAMPFSVAMEAQAYGTGIRFPANGPPNLLIPDEAIAADWQNRPDPDPDSSVPLLFMRKALSLILERHGASRAVVAGLAGPLELAVTLVGAEGLMDRLLFHPAEALALIEKTAGHFVRWANRLFADGLHLGVFVGAFCNADVLTPALAELVRPVLSQALSDVQGPLVFHHGGGRLQALLPIWTGLPHVAGYYLDARDDLPTARSIVGESPVLLGNLNGPSLPGKTPDEVRLLTRALLDRMAGDPHFIVGTSGADIPLDTQEETILAIPQAIWETALEGAEERETS
jgi:uroporphyrinogen decarboxylase